MSTNDGTVTALKGITSLDELALALKLAPKKLRYWLFLAKPSDLYSKFSIAKRRGGTREISAPVAGLKLIQRRLLPLLYETFSPRNVVHGFARERNILTNCAPHADSKFVLNVDLSDFFPSINFGRVRGALIAKPVCLPPNIATAIARLCCHDNHLPQGAPTSPVLANLVCMRLDGELLRLARSAGCRYTRYADDVTLSTNRAVFPETLAIAKSPPYGTAATVGVALESVIRSNGFVINDAKVRLYGRQTSQRVTGLVVNEFPNVDRRFVREIRAMIHAWRTHGLQQAESEFIGKYAKRHRAPFRHQPSFKRSLVGKLQFLAMVRGPANATFIRMAKQCRALDPAIFPHALDGEERVDRSVWVLECDTSNRQGSAFSVEGIGLVTCHHVLGPDTKAFHPSDPDTKYPIAVKASDEHLDLAILDVPASARSSLALSEYDAVVRHQKIMLAGYPNFGYGDGIYKVWGALAMTKVRSGVTYLVPDFLIAGGNSGGPILDERYRVIGIAARGVKSLLAPVDADVDAFAAVAVKHLRSLAPAKPSIVQSEGIQK